LYIQIYSFLYSFFFGLGFYYLLEGFNGFVKKMKVFFKCFFSFMFIFLVSLGYFLGLLFINNGVIHLYFMLCLVAGYFFSEIILKSWLTHLRKK